ncbi:VOC family protein [Ensifer soli]|uniref:VOC family protein n=1 Tax=Ciceribacter sp. sgz301302 TaxID=3342379 RepID=UPI0035B8FD20
MTAAGPRVIDHLVLPVPALPVARARLAALGFTVAADALHPFGTENCCVFLADGTYLEPLAIADPAVARAAARAGNAFVARDLAFRFRRGDDGFSGLALRSADAAGDDAAYRALGLSGGDILDFSRPVRLPDGTQEEARFRLAFCADLRSPDFLVFACQRLKALPADRAALESHANGASGLAEVILSEPHPEDFGDVLQSVLGTVAGADGTGLGLRMGGTVLSVLDPDAMAARFGRRTTSHSRGLRGHALRFRVGDPAATAALLRRNSVAFIEKANTLLVPAEAGQGCLFVFGEDT